MALTVSRASKLESHATISFSGSPGELDLPVQITLSHSVLVLSVSEAISPKTGQLWAISTTP